MSKKKKKELSDIRITFRVGRSAYLLLKRKCREQSVKPSVLLRKTVESL